MADFNNSEKNYERKELFSRKIKAGMRTYFFDVKLDRRNEPYLVITESKMEGRGDQISYDKHKIFLYKEDFEKFADCFDEVAAFVMKSDNNAPANISDTKTEDTL